MKGSEENFSRLTVKGKIIYTAGENKKVSFSAGFELDESGKEISDKPTLELQWGEKIAISIDEETIKLTNDQSTFEMKGDQILLNEGKKGGLVLIEELKQNLEKLKQYTISLNKSVSLALGAIGDGEAKGTVASQKYKIEMDSKDIQFKNMEDTKVKH